MRVRWTMPAADDLTRIVEYIRVGNPEAARRVAQTIFEGVAGLNRFPGRGRAGHVEDTREIVFPPWPYVAVYEITGEEVRVLRVSSHFPELAEVKGKEAGRNLCTFRMAGENACPTKTRALLWSRLRKTWQAEPPAPRTKTKGRRNRLPHSNARSLTVAPQNT